MAAGWLEIYAADALSANRNLITRMKKNVVYTFWFFVLVLFAFGAVVWLIAFVANSGEVIAFPVALNDILFLYFMAIMGKALLDFYHLLIERPASVFLIVQPMPQRNVWAGKLLSVTMFNLSLLAFGLAIITGFTMFGDGMHFVIPPDIVVDLIILTMLACSIGFTYSVLSGLSTWTRKLVGAALYSPIMSVLWLVTLQLRWSGWHLTTAYLAIYMVSLVVIPFSSMYLIEAWNTMTSSKANAHISKRELKGSVLAKPVRRYFGPVVLAVFEKEVRTLLRRREGIGNAITLIGFVVFAFYFFNQIGSFLQLTGFVLRLMPAIVVGLSLFLAVIMLCVIPALGVVSKDGKSAWVLKVAPVGEDDVVKGKALSILLMAPFIILAVALPLPILLAPSFYTVFFAALGAVAMCAAGTGMGIWLGARYPNFDEGTGNAPDIMTMYTVMLLTLVISVAMLLPPLALALEDKVLGALALILMTDFAFFILYAGIDGAAKSFRGLELSQ